MIDDIATHLGTLDSVTDIDVQGNKVVVAVLINNEEFSLEINLGGNFPKSLPKVYLKNSLSHGFLPHVCWKSSVCYSDGEGVSIDTNQPIAIAEYAITKAIEILSVDINKRDSLFYDEFEGYWNMQDTVHVAYSFYESGDRLEFLNTYIDKNNTPSAFFSHANNCINDEYSFSSQCKSKKTQMSAVYFPLCKTVQPPLPGKPVSIEFLNVLVNALSENNRALWNKALQNKEIKQNIHVLVSQPRPSGGKSLYGVTVPYGLNWLKGNISSYKHKIIPLAIRRHTPDYLLQRSGAQLSIIDKKITVIGCGSIGSRIAEMLIMSGIRQLTLIDGDVFTADNLFRHVLDSRYINCYKVAALEMQFKSRFPYISIDIIKEKVCALKDVPDNQDVIIDATGDPTFSRVLNVEHRKSKRATIFLSTWLEPLGLGGHAVLSDGVSNGCLHCLYHNDNSEQLYSRTNFAMPNQVMSRNLTGCGGAFIPFGAVDSMKTAEISVRMIIDALSSNGNSVEKNIKYQWWRGNDEEALKANINTTPWFTDSEHNVKDKIDLIFSEGCQVCRKN